MEQLKKIINEHLSELYANNFFDKAEPGEYSTEEMNFLLLKLIDLVYFSNNPDVYEVKKEIFLPSSWPSSSISNTGEQAIKNWENAKNIYDKPDTKWHVWKVNILGVNKPTYLSSQRIDMESILKIVSKYPEAFKSISISVENDNTKNYRKNIDTKGD